MPSAFVFCVYRDELLAWRLIEALRRFYPENPILAIADGPPADGFAAVCARAEVMLHVGDRLKPLEFGGAHALRTLKLALEMPGRRIIQIDPDTVVHKHFGDLPEADWFGSLRRVRGMMGVCGAAAGFSRQFAQRIIDSELLLDPKYKGQEFGYDRYGVHRHPWESPAPPLASRDLQIADVAAQLGVAPADWPAVRIVFRESIPTGEWAATHPHPQL